MLKKLRKSNLDEAKEAALPVPSKRARMSPLVYGAGMIAAGLLLKKVNPRFGTLPNPLQYGASRKKSRGVKAATFARDRAANFAPGNVTTKLGKSLILGGAAMLTARILDEAVGRKL
ncbi:hypothetical protein J4E08_14960 [Sagittula sp. NFXS13]|uniref:ABC-type tungstate transport system substrate-binding protein n=2 Tax=Sagittula marina TaxID=943940 RepID=A0A7W6GSN6_9RHOB|nr:hypothetical protein [Sagittula marina]MBB3985982.1 ABC-type tungstate transport system substrate-binding protein [Sagittula marina]